MKQKKLSRITNYELRITNYEFCRTKCLKIFLMSILTALWMPDVGLGQACSINCPELIKNTQLDLNPIVAPNPMNSNSFQTFNMGWVNDWQASHGSPHHFVITTCNSIWSTWGPNVKNCLGASLFNMEGIYTEVSLTDDPFVEYCLNLDIQKIHCGQDNIVEFNTSLTKNLTPIGANPLLLIPPFEPSNSNQELTSTLLTNLNLQHISKTFKVTSGQNFNQLWFKMRYRDPSTNQAGNGGIATLKNISLMCKTDALKGISFGKIQDLKYEFKAENQSLVSTFVNYRWNFGDSMSNENTSTSANPIHIFTSPGPYNVCVDIIDNNGCCNTKCIMINVTCESPEGYIDVRGVCPTFNFSILGGGNNVAGYKYIWTFGDGNVGEGKFVPHTYTKGGQFTVTCIVTNTCGESSMFTTQVTVDLPVPSFTVSDDCPSYTFTSPLVNGYMYLWDFGDGSPNVTGNMVSHSYNSNGTKVVTLTVTNSCGSVSITQDVEVNCNSVSCIDDPNVIVIGQTGRTTYISTLFDNGIIPFTLNGTAKAISGKILNLNGALIIDVPTIFSNTHWYCGPGSEIILSATLMINSRSVLEGCDKMWKGIRNYGYNLSLTNSFISDAHYAIAVGIGGPKLTILNSEFKNNYIGIYNYYTSFPQNIILTQGRILDNTFTFDGQLKEPYEGQSLAFNRSYCGVRLNNVTKFTIQGGIFENLMYGVQTSKTDLTAINVEFNRCDVGISMQELTGKNRIYKDCYFINNKHKGIEIGFSTMGEVLIEGNTFTSDDYLMTGIQAGFCYGTKIFIKNKNVFNKAYHFYSGIRIAECNPAELEIVDNDFFETNMNFHNVFPIKRALIKDNRISGLYSRFDGLNFNRCDFISNKFTASPQHWAFFMSGISQCWFSENYVENDGAAFDIYLSSDNVYCGNNMSNAFGRFTGSCMGTRYSNNKMRGFILQDEGIIGPQVNACNTWISIEDEDIKSTGYIFPGQFSTTPPITLAAASRFIYDGQAEGKPAKISPSDIENDWFNNEGAPCTGPLLNCGGSPFPLLPPDYGIPGGDTTITTGDTSIIIPDPKVRKCEYLLATIQALNALNTSLYSSTVEQSNWNLQLMLNRSIDAYGLVFWQECLDDLFALDIDITQWYDAEIDKNNAKQPSKQRLTEYNAKLAEIDVLNDQIATLTLNGNEIADPGIPSVFNDVVTKHNELATIIDVIKSESLTKAQSFYNNIHALPLRYSFLAHRKVVWAIDMKIFINGLSTITGQEWDQIRTIANMCPLDIGQAVYEARGLLGLINEYDFAPIETLCVRTKTRSISTEVIPSINIFPNPSDGVYHIHSTGDDVVMHIKVYDALGKLVLDREVSHNHSIDLSGREPGIYYYKCVMGDKTESRGKLILIK